nr:PqqD family protein [uncultured Rhodoferax sp.]
MPKISDNTRISRKVSIMAADAADQAILLDIDSGYFFQLNKSAARIWTLLESPMSLADVCFALHSNFDIGTVECAEDVRQFVADLSERGIVTLG